MPNDFVTIDYLATFAGMVLVVGLIVQFTKGFIKARYSDQVCRAYTFFWSLILVASVYWYKGLFDVTGREIAMVILLTLINSIIVTLAAMGGYELVSDPRAEKHR